MGSNRQCLITIARATDAGFFEARGRAGSLSHSWRFIFTGLIFRKPQPLKTLHELIDCISSKGCTF